MAALISPFSLCKLFLGVLGIATRVELVALLRCNELVNGLEDQMVGGRQVGVPRVDLGRDARTHKTAEHRGQHDFLHIVLPLVS